jgi:hypothetical protein
MDILITVTKLSDVNKDSVLLELKKLPLIILILFQNTWHNER